MLLSLNADCLRLVCNSLDLQSHVSLIFTCSALRQMIKEIYRVPKMIHLNPALWRYFYTNEKHLKILFECIGDNIEHLVVDGICGRNLHLLHDIHVPKLKVFALALARVQDQQGAFKIEQNLIKLLSPMSENLEELALQGISHEILYELRDLTFPNVTACSLLLRRVFYAKRTNFLEADVILTMFPKLTRLILFTDTYGRNLWLLKHLTELNLLFCQNFVEEHLTKIFEDLRLKKFSFKPEDGISCYEDEEYFRSVAACQTLEELNVEYHHLGAMRDSLPKLKALRSITFTPKEICACYTKPESYLKYISEHYGHVMDTLVFNKVPFDMVYEQYNEFLESMQNLRCLILNDSTPESELLKIMAHATGNTLQEFRYVRTYNNTNVDEGLKEILTFCKNLKVFDISSGKADLNFLKEAIEILNDGTNARLEPLIIRCNNTDIKEEDLKELILPDHVKVSLQFESFLYTESQTIHCAWKTDKE